jgi:hypothetical protein
MSFLNIFGQPTSAAASSAASAAGWQEHNVDGVRMYLNPTTGEISRTPPATRSSEADLPPGWESKTDVIGNPYYVGQLLSANGETKMYMQHDRPTWGRGGKPDAIRLSPTWKVFFTNEKTRMHDEPSVVVYENIETHEKTSNFPLASGDDLRKILTDEDAQVAAAASSRGANMYNNGYRGGKNKRKQSKRKQSKRKQSKRNATRRRMM